MKQIFRMYNSANMVATLWVLSPLLPIAMFTTSDAVPWMQWVGALIFIYFGVSITGFRKQKIEKNEWGITDLIVYIVIPGILFLLFSFITYSEG